MKTKTVTECCKNCALRYDLRKADYSHGGCEHSKEEGYCCGAFAREGMMIHMVGTNEETGLCEVFTPKGGWPEE